MNSQDSILAAADFNSAEEGPIGRQSILLSRVNSSYFWIAAAFIGCLFFAGWIGRYSTGSEKLYPLDRINPNLASKESLARLPGIGPARAQTIIEYRQAHCQNGPAFRTPADLDAVVGLGPKTVEKMMPWISFESAQHVSTE
jgi:competence ComEA-like helix-hairpin-helix protein